MINLMEELQKLMKEKPLPYGRKPIFKEYLNDGEYQSALILCSPKSIIWENLCLRDVCEAGCYVLENDEWMDYQLCDILFRRVPKGTSILDEKLSKTATLDEEWLYGIRYFYFTLIQYGDDVLRGDLEWTKETRYPPMRVPEMAVGGIYAAFKRQQGQ